MDSEEKKKDLRKERKKVGDCLVMSIGVLKVIPSYVRT